MIHTDLGSPPPPSLRDAAKALASHLRQNSAMLTMPALNAIMAVEAAVEREKDQPNERIDAIVNLRSAYDDQKARAEKAEAEVSSAAVKFLAMHQRADKAEADLAKLRGYLVSAYSLDPSLSTDSIIEKAQETIERNADQIARAGYAKPVRVSKVLPWVVDELLRLRADRENLRQALHEQRSRPEKAESDLTMAHREAADLHRMLEDAGVPGVKPAGFSAIARGEGCLQMSLGERIGWLIGQWKEQPILIDRGSAKGRMASAIAADLDTARDHLQAVVGAAKVACTAMSRAWGLVGTSEQPALDAAQTTLSAAAANARHMVLDRVDPKASAAGGLVDATPAAWFQAEIDRLRKANHDLQEQNWDLRTPDFPMLAEPPLHLHYAYMPGDWSSKSDEWFTYSRLMRNGHPTKMVRVGWRHGPGVSNRSATLSGAGSAIDSAIEKVLASWRERGKCDRKFATEVLGRFVEPKVGIVRDPVTGWTFDKFRRELDAARTTAKGNAGLFAQAMQELAAAKGGA